MPEIFVSLFSDKTEREVKLNAKNSILKLSHNKLMKSPKIGDYILLNNIENGSIFGFAILNGSFGLAHSIESVNIYKEQDFKYNKYEISVENFYLFLKPISFSKLQELIGGLDKPKTNIYKKTHLAWCKAFVKQDTEEKCIEELWKLIKIWQLIL